MYRRINNVVIPDKAFQDIVGLHRSTQVHNVYHVSGKSDEMRKAMGEMIYHEVGKGENDVTVRSPVPADTNILIINPSNELLADKYFLDQLDQVAEGCYVIAVLQDVHLHNRPRPYDDTTLPFFGKVREKYVLVKTQKVILNRGRSYRYDNEVDHFFTAYLLGRADVVKENKVDRGQYHVYNGYETEYIPPVRDGFPALDSPLNFQHPVKSVRRMPVLLKPLGNAMSKAEQERRNLQEIRARVTDKVDDIDINRNDAVETVTFISKTEDQSDSGFILNDGDQRAWERKYGREFGNESVKTYEFED
jgi:hypothetical protein